MFKKPALTSLTLICILLLASCATAPDAIYIYPDLPEFSPKTLERPVLESVPEGTSVPRAVNINTARLIAYIECLEADLKAWENFYQTLKQSWIGGDGE